MSSSHDNSFTQSKSRRQFLAQTTAALIATTGASASREAAAQGPPPSTTPGAPPAFGTAPAVGPEVTAATFAEAEKLVQAPLTTADRAQAAANWRNAMAPLYERRTGPRRIAIPNEIQPFSIIRSSLPSQAVGPGADRFLRSTADPGPLPATDREIAYAPVTH